MSTLAETLDAEDSFWRDWKEYDRKQIRKILHRREPLLNHAVYSLENRTILGTFSIPRRKRKRFTAVTMVHYLNACNELAAALLGLLAYDTDTKVSSYMSPKDFERARNENRFHIAELEKIKFGWLCGTENYFSIWMELQGVRRMNGVVYAEMSVHNAVDGKILYSYRTRLNESSLISS